MKLTTLVLALVCLLPVRALAEAPLKDRLKAAILASPLTPGQRIQHFLNRIAGGGSPSRLPYQRFVYLNGDVMDADRSAEALANEIVANLNDVGKVESSAEAKARALYPLNTMTAQELLEEYGRKVAEGPIAASRMRNEIIRHERGEHLIRTIVDDRGLKNSLFDFWFDHFNVDSHKVSLDFPAYRDTIRTSMMGTFRNLLLKVAKTPAMMIYLDNIRSVRAKDASGPNENYARELMELHTFGVGPTAGVYNQTDIQQVALVLTGWGVTAWEDYTAAHQFQFRQTLHDTTQKRVMGVVYPSAGIAEGEALLDYLAKHPRTARNISNKLVRRLVSEQDQVTEGLRAEVTGVYLTTDGDLRAMYETILTSPQFWSRDAYNQKGKRPLEFVTSALRLTAADGGQINLALIDGAIDACVRMGQEFFTYTAPTGLSDKAVDWITSSNVVEAIRYGFAVANYRYPSASNQNLYLAWEDWLASVPAQYREGYGLDGLRGFYDLENFRTRFNLSPGVDPANPGTILRMALAKPDRVGGALRPMRSAAGAFIGSKDFLKK